MHGVQSPEAVNHGLVCVCLCVCRCHVYWLRAKPSRFSNESYCIQSIAEIFVVRVIDCQAALSKSKQLIRKMLEQKEKNSSVFIDFITLNKRR